MESIFFAIAVPGFKVKLFYLNLNIVSLLCSKFKAIHIKGGGAVPEKDIHQVIGGGEIYYGTSKRVPGPRNRVNRDAEAIPYSWRRRVDKDGIAARRIQPDIRTRTIKLLAL